MLIKQNLTVDYDTEFMQVVSNKELTLLLIKQALNRGDFLEKNKTLFMSWNPREHKFVSPEHTGIFEFGTQGLNKPKFKGLSNSKLAEVICMSLFNQVEKLVRERALTFLADKLDKSNFGKVLPEELDGIQLAQYAHALGEWDDITAQLIEENNLIGQLVKYHAETKYYLIANKFVMALAKRDLKESIAALKRSSADPKVDIWLLLDDSTKEEVVAQLSKEYIEALPVADHRILDRILAYYK